MSISTGLLYLAVVSSAGRCAAFAPAAAAWAQPTHSLVQARSLLRVPPRRLLSVKPPRSIKTFELTARAKPAPTWIKEAGGLRFECTMCGACCSGVPGAVRFTDEEGIAMAKKVGVSTKQFYEQYTKKVGKEKMLLEREEEGFGMDCVFLDRKAVPGKAVCSLYEARPGQCRTWPFWPEITRSKKTWEEAGEDCPGIGEGPLYPPEEIARQTNL
mmetsp:Transcript_9216/g.22663  ORF Transcript_9216/g.22663 Transcript_9216/m.22663 type:complete len:214 (-) Transcript_9216:103-744(-)